MDRMDRIIWMVVVCVFASSMIYYVHQRTTCDGDLVRSAMVGYTCVNK